MDPIQRGAGRYIQAGLGVGTVRVQIQAGEGQFDGGGIAEYRRKQRVGQQIIGILIRMDVVVPFELVANAGVIVDAQGVALGRFPRDTGKPALAAADAGLRQGLPRLCLRR